MIRASALAAAVLASAAAAIAAEPAPAFWAWAPTPPLGWNSYDTYGDSVTEAEVLANARYLHEHLQSHGWNTVVVDYRWYDAHANSGRIAAGIPLEADAHGRLLPAVNRFPSAADGQGFASLAAQIHALGLRFGIHVMRGIPRQSVAANTPIEGSTFTAKDAANPGSLCPWNPDMEGVHGATPAGQAWYDSIFRQYAAWGVDYVKVDDLSRPYAAEEIEAIRRAIDRTGRKMVLSLSPGETPVAEGDHVAQHANLWRISDDFWDRWRNLDHQFDLLEAWHGQGGPGHWLDADMIPFGHIAIRCPAAGPDRPTRLTRDEQLTLLTLWSLNSSPLMLGMNLPDNDEWTQTLLTNDEVLAIDQDPAGQPAARKVKRGDGEVWVKPLADGDLAVGFFNRGATPQPVALFWPEAGLTGVYWVRDLWNHEDRAEAERGLELKVQPHGAMFVRLRSITSHEPSSR